MGSSTDLYHDIPPEAAYAEFGRTIALYQEIKYSSGDLSAQDYGKGAEVGKATHTGNSQNIKTSDSDFLCDVEIAARRSLMEPGHLAYFKMYYVSGLVIAQRQEYITEGEPDECLMQHIYSFPEYQWQAVYSLDTKVRTQLGYRLIETGISPPSIYLQAKDMRSPRRPKIRWSHLY